MPSGEAQKVSGWEIFRHNASLSLLLIVCTKYVAYPVILFNSLFLGIALYANSVVEGLAVTLALTALHVPVEMLAWLMTLRAAQAMAEALHHAVSLRQSPLVALRGVRFATLWAIGLYFAAAMCEWLTIRNQMRG